MDQKSAIDYLLQHTATAVSRQIDQAMQEKIGLGLAQFKILQSLEANPQLRQHQIATALAQTEASVSRQVKLLLEKGLLTSQINPQNRREHINVPTAKGLKMAAAAQEAMRQYIEPMLDTLGDKQQKQLLESLISLHMWICQPGRATACSHPFDI